MAAGAEQALGLMESNPPHVLITDFRMPPYTGEDLLCATAALHPKVHRILYTGCNDEDIRCASQVAHVVLRKGCEMNLVRETIRRCLEMTAGRGAS